MSSVSRVAALRNDNRRVEEAAQSIEDAMASLTRAICLLGFSEGKEVVQRAHLVVGDARRHIESHNGITA
jgi:hypothetical protein